MMSMIYMEMVFADKEREEAPASSNQLSYFMIAQIPDTQAFFFSSTEIKCPHTSTSQIIDMYNWIFNQHDSNCPQDTKDGRGCYQYIFHVGDIVDGDGGDDVMWPAATDIFTKIANNNAKIRIKSKLYALTIEMRQRFGQKHALLVQSTT
jgi:hypothetical protein